MFLFINDTLNNNLNPLLIFNQSVTASCNAGTIQFDKTSLGYFKTTQACANDVTVWNNDTNEVIFTTTTIPSTILYTAKLNRFVYPTIQILRTHILTSEIKLNAQVYVNDTVNGNITYDTTQWCITNGTNSLMLVCTTRKAIVNPS